MTTNPKPLLTVTRKDVAEVRKLCNHPAADKMLAFLDTIEAMAELLERVKMSAMATEHAGQVAIGVHLLVQIEDLLSTFNATGGGG